MLLTEKWAEINHETLSAFCTKLYFHSNFKHKSSNIYQQNSDSDKTSKNLEKNTENTNLSLICRQKSEKKLIKLCTVRLSA